jgi:hypothetical protein
MLLLERRTPLKKRGKRRATIGGGWLDEYGQIRGLRLWAGQGRYEISRASWHGSWLGVSTAQDLSEQASLWSSEDDVQAICLRRGKSERLEYFFCPQKEEVLRATIENAARFFELIDQRSLEANNQMAK